MRLSAPFLGHCLRCCSYRFRCPCSQTCASCTLRQLVTALELARMQLVPHQFCLGGAVPCNVDNASGAAQSQARTGGTGRSRVWHDPCRVHASWQRQRISTSVHITCHAITRSAWCCLRAQVSTQSTLSGMHLCTMTTAGATGMLRTSWAQTARFLQARTHGSAAGASVARPPAKVIHRCLRT